MSALSKVRGVNIRKDDTMRMEDEARRMELKLELLRKTLDGGDASRTSSSGGGDSGGRWRSGSAKKPLRTGYVKDVLEGKPPPRPAGKQPRGDIGARREAASENCGSPARSRGGSGRTTPTQAEPQGSPSSVLETLQGPSPSSEKAPAVGGRAASNLQSALRLQSKDALEVEAFLAGLGLDRYVSLFMEHGFDCMEVVQDMEESHMREIGMATGHALKLRKRLAELKPAPAAVPPAATHAGSLSSSSQKRVSFGGTEMQAPNAPAAGMGTGGGSLLDGHFDEEEAKASFQEAVRAWREGRDLDEGPKAEVPAPVSKLAPGAFWSSVGEVDVNLERCSTPLSTPAETMTLPSATQHDPAPSEEKLCCYQCYKQFYAKFAVERCSPLPDQSRRRLCSAVCADLWVASMQAKAAELQQRHEKLAKLEEMKRAMEYEMKATALEAGGTEPTQAPLSAVAA